MLITFSAANFELDGLLVGERWGGVDGRLEGWLEGWLEDWLRLRLNGVQVRYYYKAEVAAANGLRERKRRTGRKNIPRLLRRLRSSRLQRSRDTYFGHVFGGVVDVVFTMWAVQVKWCKLTHRRQLRRRIDGSHDDEF